jgi:hypothetical protein
MALLPPPAPAGTGSTTTTASAGGASGKHTDSDGMARLVDQVVEALEERVLGELERRGGRFLGAF